VEASVTLNVFEIKMRVELLKMEEAKESAYAVTSGDVR
jgi:hypothetical protein